MKVNSEISTFKEFIFPVAKKHLMYGNSICSLIFVLLIFADPPEYQFKFLGLRLSVAFLNIVNVSILHFMKSDRPFDLRFKMLMAFSMFLFNCPIVILAFISNLAFEYVVGYYVAALTSILAITVTNEMLNLSISIVLINVSIITIYFFDKINSDNIRVVIHFYTIIIIAYIFGRLFNAGKEREYMHIVTISKHLEQVEESEQRLRKEIDSRIKTEQALRKIQEQLKEKNKNILDFSHMITHELKKPLTCFNSVLDIFGAKKELSNNDETAEYLDIAKQATGYMEDLLKDLLEFAQWDTGAHTLNKEMVEIGKLVDDVVSRLNILINKKGIKISTNINARLLVDKKAVSNIFINLIGNSINYIGEKPNKTIEISSTFHQDNNEYIFCIKDNGIGIPETSQCDVFKKFKRGINALDLNGTGLGLPIVKNIVEMHNGNLWFESTVNEGTCFYFSLPES